MDTAPAAERTARGVRAMFDRVAPRYDLVNTVASMGLDRGWREAAARAAWLAPKEIAVDVACGPGELTRVLSASEPHALVFGVDFSWEMVRRAPEPVPPGARRVAYVAGDALKLPFADASADVVSIAFGLRNLPDPQAGLREFRRVLRPGGRLVILEFSHPVVPVFRQVYERYNAVVLQSVARLLSSDAEAYDYLARSIGAWPEQEELASWFSDAGFTQVRWRNLTGGVVAIHRGLVEE
jgi:demethylmenaquinone methyltransferase/2-methoxy-6-polyprenyl-1,4-benzoquinol methylase